MSKDIIKVGVLQDSLASEAWFYKSIQEVVNFPETENCIATLKIAQSDMATQPTSMK